MRITQPKTKLSLSQADFNIEHVVWMKAESDLISKKKEFQDEVIIAFRASRKCIDKQAKYGAATYIKFLGDVKRLLRAKGVASALLIIAEMRRSFNSLSAPINPPINPQTTTSQYSLA